MNKSYDKLCTLMTKYDNWYKIDNIIRLILIQFIGDDYRHVLQKYIKEIINNGQITIFQKNRANKQIDTISTLFVDNHPYISYNTYQIKPYSISILIPLIIFAEIIECDINYDKILLSVL